MGVFEITDDADSSEVNLRPVYIVSEYELRIYILRILDLAVLRISCNFVRSIQACRDGVTMKHWNESDVALTCSSCDFSTHSLPIFQRHVKRCVVVQASNTSMDANGRALAGLASSSSSFSKTFKCKKCDYLTTNAKALASHTLDAHNENKCMVCEYTARCSSILVRHYTDAHELDDDAIATLMPGVNLAKNKNKKATTCSDSVTTEDGSTTIDALSDGEASCLSFEQDSRVSSQDLSNSAYATSLECNDDMLRSDLHDSGTHWSGHIKPTTNGVSLGVMDSITNSRAVELVVFCDNLQKSPGLVSSSSLGVSSDGSLCLAQANSLAVTCSLVPTSLEKKSKSRSAAVEDVTVCMLSQNNLTTDNVNFELPVTESADPDQCLLGAHSKAKDRLINAATRLNPGEPSCSDSAELIGVARDEVLFECKLCSFTSSEMIALTIHMSSTHPKLFRCKFCHFTSETKSDVTRHGAVHKKNDMLSCTECMYETNLRKNFDRHWKHHVTKEAYKCYRCTFSSSIEGPVRRHIAKYHPPDDSSGDEEEEKEGCENEEEKVSKTGEEEMDINDGDEEENAAVAENNDSNDDTMDFTYPTLSSSETNTINKLDSKNGVQCHRGADKMNRTHSADLTADVDASSDEDTVEGNGRKNMNNSSYNTNDDDAEEVDELNVTVRVYKVRGGGTMRMCMRCGFAVRLYGEMNKHTKEVHGVRLKDCILVKQPPPAELDDATDSSQPSSSLEPIALSTSSNKSSQSANDSEQPLLTSLLLEPVGKTTGADYLEQTHNQKAMKCAHCPFSSSRMGDIRRHLAGAVENLYPCAYRPELGAKDANKNSGKKQSQKPKVFQSIIDKSVIENDKSFVSNSADAGSLYSLEDDSIELNNRLAVKTSMKTYANRKSRPSVLLSPNSLNSSQASADVDNTDSDVAFSTNKSLKRKREQDLDSNASSADIDENDEDVEENEDDEGKDRRQSVEYLMSLMCNVCGYMGSPYEVANHAKIHTGEKRFFCVLCPYKSGWKGDVKKHLARCHKSETEAPGKLEQFLEAGCRQQESKKPSSLSRKTKKLRKVSCEQEHDVASPPRVKTIKETYDEDDEDVESESGDVEKEFHDEEDQLSLTQGQGGKKSFLKSVRAQVKVGVEQQVTSPSTPSAEAETLELADGEEMSQSGSPSKVRIYNKTVNDQRWRPFKCSVCHRRSNWKWDIKKHIQQNHPSGKIIQISEEEARKSFTELVSKHFERKRSMGYKSKSSRPHLRILSKSRSVYGIPQQVAPSDEVNSCKKVGDCPVSSEADQPRNASVESNACDSVVDGGSANVDHVFDLDPALNSGSLAEQAREDDSLSNLVDYCYVSVHEQQLDAQLRGGVDKLKLRRFKCSRCPYRSSYRGDVTRHFKNRHKKMIIDVQILTIESATATLNTKQRSYNWRFYVDKDNKDNSVNQESSQDGSNGKETVAFIPARDDETKKATGLSSVIRKYSSHYDDFENTRLKIRQLAGDEAKCCDICPYVTEKSGHLKLHMSYHKPQPRNTYKCQYCPFFVRTARLLNHHLLLHLPKGEANEMAVGRQSAPNGAPGSLVPTTSSKTDYKYKYTCDQCPYVSVIRNDYWIHKRNHFAKPGADLKCSQCPYWVDDERLLVKHTLLHAALYCPRWQASFSELPECSTCVRDDIRMNKNDCRCVYVELYCKGMKLALSCGEVLGCPFCSYTVCSVVFMRQHYICHISLTDAARTPLFDPVLDAIDDCLLVPCQFKAAPGSELEYMDMKGSDRVFSSESSGSLAAPLLEPEVLSIDDQFTGGPSEEFAETRAEPDMPVLEQSPLTYRDGSELMLSMSSAALWEELSEPCSEDEAGGNILADPCSGDILEQAMQFAKVLDSDFVSEVVNKPLVECERESDTANCERESDPVQCERVGLGNESPAVSPVVPFPESKLCTDRCAHVCVHKSDSNVSVNLDYDLQQDKKTLLSDINVCAVSLDVHAVHKEVVHAEARQITGVPVEVVHAEAVHAKPLHAEAVHAEAVHAEAVHSEAVHTEAVPAELVHAEAVHAEAVSATAVPTETEVVPTGLNCKRAPDIETAVCAQSACAEAVLLVGTTLTTKHVPHETDDFKMSFVNADSSTIENTIDEKQSKTIFGLNTSAPIEKMGSTLDLAPEVVTKPIHSKQAFNVVENNSQVIKSSFIESRDVNGISLPTASYADLIAEKIPVKDANDSIDDVIGSTSCDTQSASKNSEQASKQSNASTGAGSDNSSRVLQEEGSERCDQETQPSASSDLLNLSGVNSLDVNCSEPTVGSALICSACSTRCCNERESCAGVNSCTTLNVEKTEGATVLDECDVEFECESEASSSERQLHLLSALGLIRLGV